VVWVGAPWYTDYGAPWYSGDDESTYVAPDEQRPSEGSPPPDSNISPARSGCRAQTYKVPSEDGGETSVKVVRC
jgi:hypothetical protein